MPPSSQQSQFRRARLLLNWEGRLVRDRIDQRLREGVRLSYYEQQLIDVYAFLRVASVTHIKPKVRQEAFDCALGDLLTVICRSDSADKLGYAFQTVEESMNEVIREKQRPCGRRRA